MANSPPRGKPEFLIVAASARFIAEAVAACDYELSTVDGFADAEVRAFARCAVQVPVHEDGLDREAVREACARLLQEREFAGVVVGPGLDAHPELIAWLSSQLPLVGNAAEVFALCRNPQRFIEQLQRLDIPHPAANGGVPALLKRAGASGGGHVRFGRRDRADERGGLYFQAYLPGTVVSHLFFARREGIATVGWNTQWQSRHDESRPFCYGGAVNRNALGATLRARAEGYATDLARALSLVGMNSMDYVVCGGELYLLELNPRMSATMQLHGDEAGVLFAAHLAACRGSPPPPSSSPPPRTHAVLYAAQALVIPDDFDWPVGACDLPAGGARLLPGEPVCTLTASASSVAEALTRVQDTIRAVAARLNRKLRQTNVHTLSEASA